MFSSLLLPVTVEDRRAVYDPRSTYCCSIPSMYFFYVPYTYILAQLFPLYFPTYRTYKEVCTYIEER